MKYILKKIRLLLILPKERIFQVPIIAILGRLASILAFLFNQQNFHILTTESIYCAEHRNREKVQW